MGSLGAAESLKRTRALVSTDTKSAAICAKDGDYPVLTSPKGATEGQRICLYLSDGYGNMATKVWYFRYRRR